MDAHHHLLLNKTLTRYFTWGFIAWSSLIACLAALSIYLQNHNIKHLASNQALSYVIRTKDLNSWLINHGGILVPTTPDLLPDPLITTQPHSIKTLAGRQYTLLNHASFINKTRQQFSTIWKAKVKMTDLKPINPANVPDDWEREALRKFAKGGVAESQYVDFNNEAAFRYMEPFITEESCLPCHAHQGYKLGEVLGGISITLPMTTFEKHKADDANILLGTFFAIWFMGVAGIRLSYRRLLNLDSQKTEAEHKLRQQNEELDRLVDERTVDLKNSLHELKKSTLLREAAFQATFDSIIILGENNRIIAINEVGAARLNHEPADMIGKDFLSFLPEDVAALRRSVIQEAITSGKPLLSKNERRDIYIFDCNVVPIYDDETNELLYVAIFASDITDRHAAEQELFKQKNLLTKQVKERTFALAEVNLELQQEASKREKAYREIEKKRVSLEEANTALKVLLAQTDSFKKEFQEQILTSISALIAPTLHDLEMKLAGTPEEGLVKTLQLHFSHLSSSFSATLSSKHFGLSSREIQIASLIKEGRTSKEIAQLLQLTPGTVSSYRDNIRQKLQIKNEKVNLVTYLQSNFS